MSARTDAHRPSALEPSEYRFLGAFYQGSDDEMYREFAQEHRALREEVAKLRPEENCDWDQLTVEGGNYRSKGTCDHCGARFAYGVVYVHEPSGDLVAVGHQCANNAFLPGASKLDRLKANKARAAKAEKTRKANEAYRAKLLAETDGLEAAFRVDHPIIEDIGRKFNSAKPNLSEKQVALVLKIAAEEPARLARLAAEKANATPVVDGKKVTITGVILSEKWVENDFGGVHRMLVKDDRGFKVWGSVPAALESQSVRLPCDDHPDGIETTFILDGKETTHFCQCPSTFGYTAGPEKGDRVTFVAGTVERSNDDESFGFYKRPSKASYIQRVETKEEN